MPDLSPILARTRDDEIMKIIFGVGAVIVWGLFQVIAAVAKKAEDAKRRQKYGRLPEDVTTRTPSFPVPPPVPQRGKQPKSKSKPKRRPIPVPQPAVIVRPTASSPAATPAYTAPVEPAPARAKPANTAASANRIGRLLRQPASLRAAFILNEVLSQPVALRESQRGRL